MHPRTIDVDGVSRTAAEWSKLTGVKSNTILKRLADGMNPREAVSKDPKPGKLIDVDGLTRTLREWSAISGVRANTINKRLEDGWPPKDAVFTPSRPTGDQTAMDEYSSWIGMRRRCSDKKRKDWNYYGGRGITVCDRWNDPENGFMRFLDDMGRKPTPAHTIDRHPNPNGNYEPNNCRWATMHEQNNNRSVDRSRIIEVGGVSKTAAEWAKETGVKVGTMNRRLGDGLDPKDAVFRSAQRSKMLEVDGVSKTVLEWAEETGVRANTIYRRIDEGMDPKDAISRSTERSYTLEVDGVSKTIVEWAEETGVRANTIYRRLANGVSPKEAVSRSTERSYTLEVDGVSKTVVEWAKETGVKADTICRRLANGASPKEAVSKNVVRSKENGVARSRLLEIDGVSKTVVEWAKETGGKADTINSRIRKGLSPKDAVFGL